MLIHELLVERRIRKIAVMYHGTSSVFLKSILKIGLNSEVKHKSWIGPDVGYESYGGVYLTDKLSIAQVAATEAVKAHGGDPIIIEVQYVLGSSGIDEDYIVNPLCYLIMHNEGATLNELVKLGLKQIQEIPAATTRQTEKLLRQFFELTFLEIERNREDFEGSDFSSISSNTEIRNIVRKIIETIRIHKLARNISWEDPLDQSFARSNVRVTRPITFRGKTRIIKIYNLITNQKYYPL